jgi:hypothetical protein
MINKNEWSLATLSEKDINLRILDIQEVVHSEESFGRMLSLKESYEREGLLPRPEIMLKVLNCKLKKVREDDETSNLCASCYEELTSNRYSCRICGNHTCKKCLVRERELKDETRTLFCEKCDLQYLQAMSGISFYNKVDELQRAFSRLVKEQESIEDLVGLEKAKLMKQGRGSATSDLIERANRSAKLTEENKVMKIQCQELQKKVEFGKTIHKDLKKKLHALRKKQKESFGTLSNNDEYHSEVEPPKLDLDMSLENLRDSVLTSEDRREDLSFMQKCKCVIY